MNYKKIYDNLISKARFENRIKNGDIYYESHHILPKCLGGEGTERQWKNHPNIILLTAKEHFIAHKLLCEIYPNNPKLFTAYFMMVNTRNHKINSKEYERLQITQSKIMSLNNPMYNEKNKKLLSERSKLNFGEKNPFYGKKHTNQTKLQIGKNQPNVKGEKNPFYGKKHTDENKLKMIKNNGMNKKIINIKTGEIYKSISELSRILNVSHGSLSVKLTGRTKNNTPYRYEDKL